jgi:hypothetical protein
MPWKQAILLAGSESSLIAGVKDRTWKWWRSTDRVPADRLTQFVLKDPLALPLVRETKAEWQMEGVQDRRAFTALVEALRIIDEEGSDKEWRAAWATIRGALLVLQRLADFNDDHWRRIFEGDGKGRSLDHWRKLTSKSELSLTEEGRR